MNEACCGEWGRNLFHCHSNLLVLPFLFNIHSLGTLPFVLKFVFRKLLSTCSFRKQNQLISINLHLRLIQDLYIKDYAKTFSHKYINHEEIEVSPGTTFGYIVIEGSVSFRFSKIKEISAQVNFFKHMNVL